jgi:UDP-GlcNAc:undecaprenyl-phosphate GlcNAc-1-phosphate transferase
MISLNIFLLIIFISSISIFYSLKVLIDYKKISNANFKKRKNLKRWGNSFKSHLGGLAFLLGFLIALFIAFFFYDEGIFSKNLKILFLLILTCSFSLCDDILLLSAKVKVFFQILISINLIIFDFDVEFFNIYFLDLFLNLLFFLIVFNITNFFDNFDGGLLAIYWPLFLFFLVFGLVINVDIHIKLITSIYLISLTIFYYFNSYPSKIFMGDIGSSQLALISIILGHQIFWKDYEFTNYIYFLNNFFENYTIYLLLSIDLLLVTIYRLSIKKPIFVGDTNHLSHVLLKFLKKPQKVFLIMFVSQTFLVSTSLYLKLSGINDLVKLSVFLMLILSFVCGYALIYSKYVRKK